MSLAAQPKMSVAEYLAFELASPDKHMYFEGEVYAMGGACARHSLVALNVGAELRSARRGKPCRVFSTDLRVKVSANGLYTYPDVTVACGALNLESPGETLTNPNVVVEVHSESTEKTDRGWKFDQYRMIESLREYLLVAHDTAPAELFTRQADGCRLYQVAGGLTANLFLESIGCHLGLASVYDKVEGLADRGQPPAGTDARDR